MKNRDKKQISDVEVLTKERIRADLVKKGKVGSTRIIAVLICLPLAAVCFLLGGSVLMGCIFVTVPLIICGAILLSTAKIRRNWKEFVRDFDSGRYSLLVTGISRVLETRSEDRDGHDWTSYEIFFPRENGGEDWSFRVNGSEFREAYEGKKYYLAVIRGEALALYPCERCRLSPELDFKLRIDEGQEKETAQGDDAPAD